MFRIKTRLPMNWYRLAILVVIIDQLAKRWISESFQYGEQMELLPVLDLTLAHNTGAAFSFLHDAGGWQRWFFAGIAGAVSVFMTIWMTRLKANQYLLLAALALVLGGAVGNLIDRMHLGYVIDFVSVHWGDHYFPAFNVADSAITIGAILMVLDMYLNPQHHNSSSSEEAK